MMVTCAHDSSVTTVEPCREIGRFAVHFTDKSGKTRLLLGGIRKACDAHNLAIQYMNVYARSVKP
jgi:hypothetical protein